MLLSKGTSCPGYMRSYGPEPAPILVNASESSDNRATNWGNLQPLARTWKFSPGPSAKTRPASLLINLCWQGDGILLRCSNGMKQLPDHQKLRAIMITCMALRKWISVSWLLKDLKASLKRPQGTGSAREMMAKPKQHCFVASAMSPARTLKKAS